MSKKAFWISFFVLSVLSTLFHFLYDFTQFAPFMLIAPINESVWEHSKILVFPFLFFMLVYYLIKKPQDKLAYFSAAAKASWAMQLLMITLFYTYSGILGRNFLICDILLTYICIFVGLLVFSISLKNPSKHPKVWIILYVVQIVLLIVFTFWQPSLALFQSI